MERSIQGVVWKFGDNVDTDQIIPAEYLVTSNSEQLAEHAFEKARPEFAEKVSKGDIILAGHNFGSGSSREHAPRALLGAGISCVIAKSFARIFFRNSINIGLPLIESDIEAEEGDMLRINFDEGTVENLNGGVRANFTPYSDFLQTIIEKGGLIPFAKERIAEEQE